MASKSESSAWISGFIDSEMSTSPGSVTTNVDGSPFGHRWRGADSYRVRDHRCLWGSRRGPPLAGPDACDRPATSSVYGSMDNPLVSARGLTKHFDELVAVDSIDFDVKPGEAFGFLGPNGAGKSSTMKMIGAVSPITEGGLTVLGLDPMRDGPDLRARLGVVPHANHHSQFHAQHLGQAEDAEICCGQVAGLITGIPEAGKVVGDIAKNIKTRLEELQGKVNDFF